VSALSNSSTAGEVPLLCYVTDRRALSLPRSSDAGPAIRQKIEILVAAGIDGVQIREKDLAATEISALARVALRSAAASARTAGSGVRILINDRLDVALAEGAGGVHLGEQSLPVKDARSLVGKSGWVQDFLVGVSCHTVEAARSAWIDGADYIFFGPVFATPSKASFGSPQGVDRLAQVCRAASIPVLAIGGISLDNAGACIAAGAAGIAAIRLFQDAADPVAVIRTLRGVVA
jgi:thiamine-phosphate pyrophosphorylase